MVHGQVFKDTLDDGIWHWNVVNALHEAIANQLVEALIKLRLFAGQLAVSACLENVFVSGLASLFEDRRLSFLSDLSRTLLDIGFNAFLHLFTGEAFAGKIQLDYVVIDHVGLLSLRENF